MNATEAIGRVDAASLAFDAPDLFDWLLSASTDSLDAVAFGVVGMTAEGTVEQYNLAESALSGLGQRRVIGRNFFTSVAPCTNNALVAHRFALEPEIDAFVPYVFTFRMAPTRVRLRLLKRAGAERMYLAVEPCTPG